MHYSLACLSDTGSTREHNEDNYAFLGKTMPEEHQDSAVLVAGLPPGAAFAVGVFDGMGGEVAGEVASFEAAQAFVREANRDNWSNEALRDMLIDMDRTVSIERDKRRVQTMGTTATVLAVQDGHAYIANVGDSPAFLVSNGVIRTLSHAHTNAETLRFLGISDRKPGLTQFLGMFDGETGPNPHVTNLGLEPGYAILLASDGLTESTSEEQIIGILAMSTSTERKAKGLRDIALQNGSTDNITVILCEVFDSRRQIKGVGR